MGAEEVQCDVMRSSISPMIYRCFLRLGGLSSPNPGPSPSPNPNPNPNLNPNQVSEKNSAPLTPVVSKVI